MSKESEKPVEVLMKVRLVRHDGSNWYGDAEIGNEYEIVKVNERTYTIKMDDKFSVGLDKDHCEIIFTLPQEILTEEELKEIIGLVEYDIEEGHQIYWGHAKILLDEINRLKESELSYLSANAELSFKNAEQRKTIDHQHILLEKYESMLNGG